jgi:hypothetical protein
MINRNNSEMQVDTSEDNSDKYSNLRSDLIDISNLGHELVIRMLNRNFIQNKFQSLRRDLSFNFWEKYEDERYTPLAKELQKQLDIYEKEFHIEYFSPEKIYAFDIPTYVEFLKALRNKFSSALDYCNSIKLPELIHNSWIHKLRGISEKSTLTKVLLDYKMNILPFLNELIEQYENPNLFESDIKDFHDNVIQTLQNLKNEVNGSQLITAEIKDNNNDDLVKSLEEELKEKVDATSVERQSLEKELKNTEDSIKEYEETIQSLISSHEDRDSFMLSYVNKRNRDQRIASDQVNRRPQSPDRDVNPHQFFQPAPNISSHISVESDRLAFSYEMII